MHKKHLLMLHGTLFIAIAVFLLITYFTGIGCPFRALTGIPCPGCGLSRALFSAVTLDFQSAFFYHPLFFIAPFYLFTAVHFSSPLFAGKRRPVATCFLILGTMLFVLVYIYRLVFDMIP